MAKRTQSQRLGSLGHRLVTHMIELSEHWIARAQDEDFGIDLEAELSSPEVSGQLLKIQIKSSKSIRITKQGVPFRIRRSLIAYADSCRLPVIQVHVDLKRGEAWYLWLQGWLLKQRQSALGISDLPLTVTDYVPIGATLSNGLSGELQDIAHWHTDAQLVIVLNDAIRAAATLYRVDVLNPLVDLLARLDVINETFPINFVIDHAISLGTKLWATVEGNQASNTLYAVCRRLGRSFSAEQVWRMVTREGAYSRVGVNALGILYDDYFEHMAELDLISLFEKDPHPRIAYYCKLRELCPGRAAIQCVDEATELEFVGLRLHPSFKNDRLDKWANRGDSAILDYLIEVPGSAR